MRGQQGGAKDEENVGGEDPPLHHVRLPDAERALLLRVLEHKLPADGQQKVEAKVKVCRERAREIERERQRGRVGLEEMKE